MFPTDVAVEAINVLSQFSQLVASGKFRYFCFHEYV
jgi:hypothetical protein